LILVTGAGGFIGGHLVRSFLSDGHAVRAVDIQPLSKWHQLHEDAENLQGNLSELDTCREATEGVDQVYNLAADMGGMGFIANHKAECMLSVLPSTHMLLAAVEAKVQRFFYSSSACVYPDYRQDRSDVTALRESDAYPAMPEDGYGWEKLFTERMCSHFYEDFGLEVRIARYHNVYGPYGTYDGGREKAPAAICRKVVEAQLDQTNQIEIWGDGEQTRSFTYIDDCIRGTRLIMDSDVREPLNLGSDELVTINQLVAMVEEIAGVRLERVYVNGPQGVRGRNSDNTLLRKRLGWEPTVSLFQGLSSTYRWISSQLSASLTSPLA